jgi:hypothetical protein
VKTAHLKRSQSRADISLLMNLQGDHSSKALEVRDYYVDLKTGATQWTRPYHERTYYSHDLELESFVAIMVQRDLFMLRYVFRVRCTAMCARGSIAM